MKYSYLHLFCFTVLLGCSKAISPVDSALDHQILHIGNGSEPQGLDPHIVTGVPEHHLLIAMCEGLVIANPNGGENLPGVAKSWTISPDGKTYTFFLQENARWSNGDRLTASDFVCSWKRILTPSLGSQYPDMLYYVKGAPEFHQGLTDDFSTVGVTAVNDRELRVELTYATPFFIKLLSHYSTYPVHQDTVLKHGSIDDRNGQWTRPGNFVCNGPMNLNTWELNKEITVTKNPLYWDADSVRLKEIRYYPVSNESTEDRMFRAGQLHVTYAVPLEKCPVYIENNNPDFHIDPYMGTYFYRINTKDPVLKDRRVRLALAYALNRQQIVEKVSKCGQSPAYSFTPPGTAGYEPDTSIEFNPELAKSLLADAGYQTPRLFQCLRFFLIPNRGIGKLH